VLIGTEYWRPLEGLLRHLADQGTIDVNDLALLLITDDVNEALEHIRSHAVERFGLTPRRPHPSTWLGERSTSIGRRAGA
jgi:predicted Rossmann-fold nucleotide-binding protein